MTPEDELLAVFARWHQKVEKLAVWSGGEARLHDLLQMAVGIRAEQARHGVALMDFPWESLVDRVAQWHYDHPLGTAEYSLADVRDAVLAAVESTRVEPLEDGVRRGAFRVRKTGGGFRVRHRWDVSLEVADMYLERQARPGALPGPTEAERQWAAVRKREKLNAFAPPAEILQIAMRRTGAAVDAWRAAQQDLPLSDDFELGDGLTVGIMRQVLACLMAIAELSELAHARVRAPGTMLLHVRREALAGWLVTGCEGLSAALAETAVLRLMAGARRSVRSSVLLPNGPFATVLPLTLFPRAIEPVMLRTAATEHRRYGPIGEKQGDRARAWGRWLKGIPGVKVAEGLKVRGAGGRTLGDLDLLAVDPDAGKGIILELKWPIDALTLHETEKTDDIILAGSRQLAKRRREVRDEDGTVKLPPGWPALSDVEWTWGVGTPQQLYTGPLPEPEMYATSLRYMQSLGSPESIETVISALCEPDVPRLGEHYTVKKTTMQLGWEVIHFDSIHVLDTTWRPRPA
jgi:hypothetical protein